VFCAVGGAVHRDCCPHGLAKRAVVTVVTTKPKNVGRTRVAIAVAAVLVVPALLNMLTNEVLRARHPVPLSNQWSPDASVLQRTWRSNRGARRGGEGMTG
jgi:hypothetical protein